jgi:hypothetical protein
MFYQVKFVVNESWLYLSIILTGMNGMVTCCDLVAHDNFGVEIDTDCDLWIGCQLC